MQLKIFKIQIIQFLIVKMHSTTDGLNFESCAKIAKTNIKNTFTFEIQGSSACHGETETDSRKIKKPPCRVLKI